MLNTVVGYTRIRDSDAQLICDHIASEPRGVSTVTA
jgi:hypothetical protein